MTKKNRGDMTQPQVNSQDANRKSPTGVADKSDASTPYLTTEDLEFLEEAARFFADPGVVAKGLAWAGRPVASFQKRLPEKVMTTIAVVSERAIQKAMIAAVKSLPKDQPVTNRDEESLLSSRIHRGLTTLTGAAGGLLGLPALAIELPVTTVLILRAISDQARLFGHDLNDLETRLECLMVFTMGVPDSTGEFVDKMSGDTSPQKRSIASYFLTRASFVGTMREAVSVLGAFTAKELASTIERGAAPMFARLAANVAEKFQVRVSQKVMAEGVPLIGAFGGGALNYAFTDFFVKCARYHFGIRALEKKHGEQMIQDYLKSARVNTGATN